MIVSASGNELAVSKARDRILEAAYLPDLWTIVSASEAQIRSVEAR
jgi:hypothetical protein